MATKILRSQSGTLTVNTDTSGFVSVDVNIIPVANITGLAPSATLDTSNASNITKGTLPVTANNSLYLGGVIDTSYVNTTGNYSLSGNISFGNSSVSVSVNSIAIVIGNSSVNSFIGSNICSLPSVGYFEVGNSTSCSFSNSTVSMLISSTGNSILTANSLTFGNSIQNTVINSTSIAYNGIGTRGLSSVVHSNIGLAANSNTIVQAVFPSGQQTANLASSTSYLIDALYMISNAVHNVATSVQTSFGNTAPFTLYYSAISSFSNNDGGTVNALTTAVYATSEAITDVLPTVNATNGTFVVHIKGSVMTASVVSITPQISFSVACNSTPQVLAGSYITFTPLANSVVNCVGSWV
jgi:hypothetical protein